MPAYRRATEAELQQFLRASRLSYRWSLVREAILPAFGANAAQIYSITLEYGNYFNDESYHEEVRGIYVRDAEGRSVRPDLSVSPWNSYASQYLERLERARGDTLAELVSEILIAVRGHDLDEIAREAELDEDETRTQVFVMTGPPTLPFQIYVQTTVEEEK